MRCWRRVRPSPSSSLARGARATPPRRAGATSPSHDVDASDTVAAGDAFGGAFTVALAEGRSVAEAVRYGTAAGALAVTKPGAQEAMPTRAEVEGLLAG